MTKLNEVAKEYVAPTTETIDKLDSFSVDVDVVENEYTDSTGKTFTVFESEIDGVKYRIPKTVIKDLKLYLEENPKISKVKVKKTGEGLNSTYTLIVLE